MNVRYDPEIDALYIALWESQPNAVECRELTPELTADYGPDGKLVGLEILDASAVLGSGKRGAIVEQLIGRLPEGSDPEEFVRDLHLRVKIGRAEAAVAEGKVLSHEEVVERSRQWFE